MARSPNWRTRLRPITVSRAIFVAALQLLLYLLFYRRAQRAMPKVRDWMDANSWLVNIIVCIIFTVLVLF
jgi:Sap, sulfolipid-1-addressing protein